MPLAVRYDVDGLPAVHHRLRSMELRFLDTTAMLKMFVAMLRKIERELFEQEGKGQWPPLSPVTVERKGHDKILRETDALMESLTEEGAAGSFEIYAGDEVHFGTNVVSEEGFNYPGALQSGTAKMPPRDPLPGPDQADLRAYTKGIQAYLVGVDRAMFGLNGAGDWADQMPRSLA